MEAIAEVGAVAGVAKSVSVVAVKEDCVAQEKSLGEEQQENIQRI